MIERYVDAAELRRLLRTLLVILGALVVAGLFASIVVPGLRNANRPAAPPAADPVGGEWGWLDPNAFPPLRGYAIPPLDRKLVLAASSEQLAQGKALYARNCEQCHGVEGRGDGPAGVALQPKPRNLTQAAGWKNGPSLPGVFKTLSEGLPRTSMAPFGYLRPRDRLALTQYARRLQQFEQAEDRPALEALAAELSRSGGRVPNRIPVGLAIDKLAGEARSVPALVEPPPADDSPGGRLLRETLADGQRAATTLAGSAAWRGSPEALARLVSAGAPTNGFAVRSLTFGRAEWETLRVELLRRVGD